MELLKATARVILAVLLGLLALGAVISGAFVVGLVMFAGVFLIFPNGGNTVGRHFKPLALQSSQVVVGLLLVFGAWGTFLARDSSVRPETTAVSPSAAPAKPDSALAKPQFDCAHGEVADGSIVDVRGSEGHELRSSPGGERIINVKATRILGSNHYQTVDSSTRVRVRCRHDEWTEVQVTEPASLAGRRGWVQSSVLAPPRAAGEPRTFTAEDIYWDEDTQGDREVIVRALNRLLREDPRCRAHIEPGTVTWSKQESAERGERTYFVACGRDEGIVNVYFSAARVDDATPFSAPEHIDRMRAVDLCEAYAKSQATHPSSVDFSRLLDLAASDHPNGRTTVTSTFTARNSFNLELTFNIRCLLDASGLIEGSVAERR